MTAVLIIAALLLLNALFVAAEFAIVAAPKTTLERRAAKGERLAEKVFRVMTVARDQDRFIATAQIGITLASLGLGMYGEHAVADWLAVRLEVVGAGRFVAAHTLASLVAIAALTFLHIALGEMIPKTLALQRPAQVALAVARPMFAARTVLYPLVVALNASGNAALRLIGVDRALGTEHYYTPEELGEVIDESARKGLLHLESSQVVRELLEFGDLSAREVMVPRVRVVGIEVGSTPDELRALLNGSPHTRYPVHTGDLDHTVGTVHIKDLVRVLRAQRPLAASDARPIPYVPEAAPLDDVLDTMRLERTQVALVLDEHGGTSGLVTIEDLFEEIVGDIADGAAPRAVYRDRAGLLHVAGTVRVAEVGEALGVELEHPEVDSVSGLVLTLLGRVPSVADEVEFEGVRFRVVATQGNGVRQAVVERVDIGLPESGTDRS